MSDNAMVIAKERAFPQKEKTPKRFLLMDNEKRFGVLEILNIPNKVIEQAYAVKDLDTGMVIKARGHVVFPVNTDSLQNLQLTKTGYFVSRVFGENFEIVIPTYKYGRKT